MCTTRSWDLAFLSQLHAHFLKHYTVAGSVVVAMQVGAIESEFRTCPLEVIAGDGNLNVEARHCAPWGGGCIPPNLCASPATRPRGVFHYFPPHFDCRKELG
jgi:hypothetical protein